MKILQTEDGFLWGVVTDKAVDLWELKLGPLYVLYDDGSEAMVETVADIESDKQWYGYCYFHWIC